MASLIFNAYDIQFLLFCQKVFSGNNLQNLFGLSQKLCILIASNPWLLAEGLLVPSAVILIGSFAKKLARGQGWKLEDFFFGIELNLSALSGALTILINPDGINNSQAPRLAIFLVITLCILFVLMSLQQDHKGAGNTQEFLWLVIFSNFIGIVSMFWLITWIQVT